ncbi:hypothetical protein Patl1_13265 [Pistacia atlantica]|uniref:Uncharacterized protein n=1 Tax=Pistacia atlantica TaxID=434234 RepID=A0ACC1AYH7_9ROSI|nr:hypothetical protein Patl1_13265 [Pistacia atlantica]
MVRALDRGHSIQKSISFHSKKMSPGKQTRSMVFDNGSDSGGNVDDNESQRPSSLTRERTLDRGLALTRERGTLSRLESITFTVPAASSPVEKQPQPQPQPQLHPSDMELMKEKFAKLLLGEDMSGGGKGVSSALALSNAVTNLAASIFGEQRKLEPMAPERKSRWRKEINWLLSVTDHIVEFVPSQQKSKDGVNMEIMVTKQRNDLHMDIPALRKLDAMLIDCLDCFGDKNEFWYPSGDEESGRGSTPRNDDKWWIPIVKVPTNGLSDAARKLMQCQKESVNQVLKAAMAINAQVLSEMEIPESYIESLPKNGRSSLGDSIYKSITVELFDPEQLLSTMDLSTEHLVLDLKNRIEASIVIWKRKMHHSKDSKSSWGSAVSLEKRELFEERAETILLLLKQRFPGSPQSALDISKIQYNRDVGQAILESYSRVIESLAFTVISRIEDVLYADSYAQTSPLSESNEVPAMESPGSSINNPGEEWDKTCPETPNSKTLSDFMGWEEEQIAEAEAGTGTGAYLEKTISTGNVEGYYAVDNEMMMSKPPPTVVTPKKYSYLEKLENLSGLRSPAARH